MASTFANAAAHWRVRTDGSQLNGGGFDGTITNAGTDYTDQASPQISSTTGTCTAASTTWVDSSVTFTAAMIGNVMRISAATGGTSTALDYFVITGYTSASTITLDRSPAASTNITAATYTVGGAFASLQSLASSGSGLSAPTLATPLLAGNTIYIRGSGVLDNSSNDYDWSAGTWTFPGATLGTDGSAKVPITLVGYNGRPRIAHCGALLTTTGWEVKHVSFFRKLNTNISPIVYYAGSTAECVMTDCIIDSNNIDVTEYYGVGGGFNVNEVRSTGATTSGTNPVICLQHPGGPCIGNYIHGVRGQAISNVYTGGTPTTFITIAYNTIVNNFSDAINLSASTTMYNMAVFNNTIDNNAGNAFVMGSTVMAFLSCFNNIISNHTGVGKAAFSFTDSYVINNRLQRNVFDANCFWNNTADFNTVSSAPAWTHQTHDIQANPGYANASSGNYVTGPNVSAKGLSGLGGVGGTLGTATAVVNIGAWQGVAPTPSNCTYIATLGALTTSSAATNAIVPSYSSTLGALTTTGISTVGIVPNSSITLAQLTSSDTATAGIVVTDTATLDNIVTSSTATLGIVPSVSITLGTLLNTDSGVVGVIATDTATLGSLITSSVVTNAAVSIYSSILNDVVTTSTTNTGISATDTAVLGTLVLSGTATASVIVTDTSVLGSLTATSGITNAVVSNASIQLDSISVGASVVVSDVGNYAETLDALVISGDVSSAYTSLANSNIVFDSISGNMGSNVGIVSSVSSQLSSITVSSTVNAQARSNSSINLGSLIGSAGITSVISSNANITDLSVSNTTTGTNAIEDILTKTLSPVTVTSAGNINVVTNSSITLDYMSVIASDDSTPTSYAIANITLGNIVINSNTYIGIESDNSLVLSDVNTASIGNVYTIAGELDNVITISSNQLTPKQIIVPSITDLYKDLFAGVGITSIEAATGTTQKVRKTRRGN